MLLPGVGAGTSVALGGGGTVSVAEGGSRSGFVVIRPESGALYLDRPAGSPRNVWQLRLASATPHGAVVRCDLAGEVPLTADVTATSFAELGLTPGVEVWASVKASEVAVHTR